MQTQTQSPAEAAMDTVPVAEVVTFTLLAGSDEVEFVTAAQAMEPFLRSTGHMIRRTLSKADDGTWTDHIVWSSMEAAQTAAEAMMAQPEAGPFMGMINPEGVVMRHDRILMQQE